MKDSVILKLNESGKRKIAAWLMYHGKLSVDREEIFERAELAMQAGQESVVLAKEETDRYSRNIPVIQLVLDISWFDHQVEDAAAAGELLEQV